MLKDNRKCKNKIINVAVLLAIWICVASPGSACFASRSGDLEYWQAHDFSFDLEEDVAFTVSQELRFGRSGSEPHQYNVDLGIVYSGLAEGPRFSGTRRPARLVQRLGATPKFPP